MDSVETKTGVHQLTKSYVAENPTGIFGVPLQVSIRYAHVAISLTNEHGESFVYGYVPIVVAKCGVFLKEKGTSNSYLLRNWIPDAEPFV